MNKSFSLTIKLIVILLFIHLLVMILFQEVLFFSIDDMDLLKLSRISSLMTIILSSIFMFIIFILIIITPYYTVCLYNKIEYKDYFIVVKSLFYTYLSYELLRGIIICFFVVPVAEQNSGNIQFIESFYTHTITGSSLLFYDLSLIPVLSVICALTYYFKVRNDITETVISGLTLFALLCLLNMGSLRTAVMLLR